MRVTAVDGSYAQIPVPYGPFGQAERTEPGLELGPLLAHLERPRRIGLALVRSRAHSLGIAEDGIVRRSSTDRQARASLRAAAEDIRRVLVPELDRLDAVVLAGDESLRWPNRGGRRSANRGGNCSTRSPGRRPGWRS
ncbi:hypothetical protein [Sciscionella marina]|uniref:hypothetical protein n=1 Tax=Sciscionella marina TaxID=508770 RepID=UPI0012F6E861|nr:hypothetical protein [Sciscionella marina]